MSDPSPSEREGAARAGNVRQVVGSWLRFALYVLGSFALLYGLDRQIVTPFTRVIALVTKALLGLGGVEARVTGTVVATPTFSVAIQNNCNAIYEIALFTSAVLAFPATWRERAWGALLGFASLYVVNLIRVLSLIYVGSHFREYFQLHHVYLWQSLFIAFALVLWTLWAGRLVKVARS